jgi:hypothetical protein
MIRFDLSITLDYNVLSPTDFVFIIQPTNTPYQRVTWERLVTEPAVEVAEELHGAPANRHLRMHAEPGAFQVRYDAIVDLVHHFALPADLPEQPIHQLPASVLQYIYPSRYCPSDKMLNVAREKFGTMTPGYQRVEAIRSWVQSNTRFQIGSSNPNTCALDTYQCATGVCRDFAHLMITMCRALNIPLLCRGVPGRSLVPVRSHRHLAAHGVAAHGHRARRGRGGVRDHLRHGAVDHAAHQHPRGIDGFAQRHRRAVPA